MNSLKELPKLRKLLDNWNLGFIKRDGELYVYFEPYNRTLDINYVKRWLEIIKKAEEEIKQYYKVDNFAINLSSNFNLDGLIETNNVLVSDGGMLNNNYVDEYRTIRIKIKEGN